TGGIGEEHAIPYVATKANTVDRLASYFNSGNRSLFTPGNALITVGPHMAGDAGVYFLATDEGNPSNGMIAYAAINYATGWQPGDIRLATLCDGAAGAIAASGELLTNNEFTSDLSGWTVSTPTDADDYVIWSSGAARLVSTSELVNFSQTITTVIGQTYNVEVEISAAATGGVRLQIGGTVGIIIASMTAAGTYFASFTAVSTSSLIAIHRTNSVSDISITRVSAKLAVVDRSYRNQGLNVVGTLIRAAVNTGNDIAAWSGLSSSNYLEQPYNANLDFGTGDFSIAFWHKGTSFTVGGDRAVPATTNPRINVGAAGGSIPRFVVNDGTTGNRLVDATTPFNSGVWNQCVCIRRGQTLEMWVNGIREGVSTVTTLGSLTAVGAIFRLGTNVNDASSASGAFALYRISAYAPTPAQIAKMYADERPLFDAGAKAFLGGTSNGVTALSFSETTRRLAVATGDGVSIFSGLRRVEYLDAANTPLAIANDTMRAVSMEGGVMAVATTNNAGVRRDAITGLDRMPAGPVALNTLRRMRAGGTTTDATPLSLSPRVHIGPRETVIIEARIVGRVYGASDTERLSYVRRGVYYRQDGGNVTLQGSVQTIGTDTETTAGADATLAIDTTAQTVTPQVTGVAATRIVWSAETRVQRVSEVAQYEEIA
ncbi:LamG domain-containing protein, partial [Falsiroseomonas sp.]|uniref:LamG domain-containing protein n=1 Tax=Falsiroseomonas sp. TaxID=2870721 RepID=UPI0027347BE3